MKNRPALRSAGGFACGGLQDNLNWAAVANLSGVILFPGRGHGNSLKERSDLTVSFRCESSADVLNRLHAWSLFAEGSSGGHDEFDCSRDETVHDSPTDHGVGKDCEPILRGTI